MSLALESALVDVLQAQCPRVQPMVAAIDTALPYVTWQHIGGASWRFIDNSAAAQRLAMVQVNVWAATAAGALTLMRQIEDALCAASTLTARPLSEPIGQHEADFNRFGFLQDFEVTAAR